MKNHYPILQCSPLGLVPKKQPGEYRLIHHLSYPNGASINDFPSRPPHTNGFCLYFRCRFYSWIEQHMAGRSWFDKHLALLACWLIFWFLLDMQFPKALMDIYTEHLVVSFFRALFSLSSPNMWGWHETSKSDDGYNSRTFVTRIIFSRSALASPPNMWGWHDTSKSDDGNISRTFVTRI